MGKSAFEQKLDVLQVQRAEVFQDSLDDFPSHLNQIIEQSASKGDKEIDENQAKTKVLNEEGQLCEVIFDPVLKCYYEPSANVYYQVKDVQ